MVLLLPWSTPLPAPASFSLGQMTGPTIPRWCSTWMLNLGKSRAQPAWESTSLAIHPPLPPHSATEVSSLWHKELPRLREAGVDGDSSLPWITAVCKCQVDLKGVFHAWRFVSALAGTARALRPCTSPPPFWWIFSLFALFLSHGRTVLVQQKADYFVSWFHSWTFYFNQILLFCVCVIVHLYISRAESWVVQSWPWPLLMNSDNEGPDTMATENKSNHFPWPSCHLAPIIDIENSRTRLNNSQN